MNFAINKKILVLGANSETIPIVKKALSMGCKVFVSDPYNSSPAKLIKGVIPVNIDGNDVKKLANYCLAKNISSVVLGVADRLVLSYNKLCEHLGAFCIAKKNITNILSNKLLFNKFCKLNKLSTIPNIHKNKLSKFFSTGGKLVIKPVDSNSSKGLEICEKFQNFEKLVKRSMFHSKSSKVFLEEYMNGGGIGIYLTFSNGRCINFTIYDRITSEGSIGNNNLPLAGIYPSRYLKLYKKSVHKKLVSALKKEGLNNGVLMISAFVKKNKLYLYDPGFRLQGEGSDIIVKYNTGLDQLENLIIYAIYGKFRYKYKNNQINSPFIASLWIYLSSGKVNNIDGIEKIKNNPDIIEFRQRLFVGSKIKNNDLNTEASVGARIYVRYNKINQLKKILRFIKKNLKFNNYQGENLIRKSFLKILQDIKYYEKNYIKKKTKKSF